MGGEDVLDAHSGQAGVSRDRAVAGPAEPARGGLVAEQFDVRGVRRPLHRGHDGREQAHDPRTDRGGEVRGAGVADDDHLGAGEHGGQLGRRGAAAEVERRVAGHRRRERAFTRTAGDDHGHAPLGVGRHQRAVVVLGPRPRRHARAGVDDHVAVQGGHLGWCDGVATDREPPVVRRGQREARRLRDLQGALRLRELLRQVLARAQPHVEERPRVVDRRAGDAGDAGQAEQQRDRQGRLVERGEDDGLVGLLLGDQGTELAEERVVDRPRRLGDPRGGPDAHTVDAGQQVCRRSTLRTAEHRDVRGTGGHRPDGRAGDEDVAERVEADDQDAGTGHRHARPGVGVRRRRAHARPAGTRASTRSTASARSAATVVAASTSSVRVRAVGTRMPCAPAAAAAPTSAPMSPTTTSSDGSTPSRSAASSTMPGRGFRHEQPSPASCGQTHHTSNGPTSSSTRALVASTCSRVARPLAIADWLVTTPTSSPAARARSTAR
ncbi:hypothetical protein Cus16_0391 [Curtobacterium sp. ER1/6]|nr:hypothetical protein Cus16_0391 [Curtobacterium sp. ER1/6]